MQFHWMPFLCMDFIHSQTTLFDIGRTEPLELSYLLGIAVGSLAALLILLCWCIYAIRAKKCCFKSEYFFFYFIALKKLFPRAFKETVLDEEEKLLNSIN